MEQNPEIQEQTPMEESPVEQQPRYVPRPMWQVWAARIGLVLFIILLIVYYVTLFRGGYR